MRNLILFLGLFCAVSALSQTDLLVTDFQSGIPSNYTIIDGDGLTPDPAVSEYTGAWIVVADPDSLQDTVASSTSYFSPVGTADRWLITPPLSLGNYGNFIEWQGKSQDASYADDYLVLVSTTDNQIASFTDTIGYVIQENSTWTNRTVDLSMEGYNGQTIYIAFRLITNDGFKLYLDDIHVWKNDPAAVAALTMEKSISCYPNPASHTITIQSKDELVSCKVLDINGTELVSSESPELNVEHLPNGVYFIQVTTATSQATLRFVKI